MSVVVDNVAVGAVFERVFSFELREDEEPPATVDWTAAITIFKAETQREQSSGVSAIKERSVVPLPSSSALFSEAITMSKRVLFLPTQELTLVIAEMFMLFPFVVGLETTTCPGAILYIVIEPCPGDKMIYLCCHVNIDPVLFACGTDTFCITNPSQAANVLLKWDANVAVRDFDKRDVSFKAVQCSPPSAKLLV